MELVEKSILTEIYLAGISGKSHMESLKIKKGFTENIINSKMDEIVKNKLVKEDRITLTELGRSSLRVVLAGGVFDIIHPGHIHTLNAAKALGDVLIVVVATDNTAVKMKKRQPLHSKEQRQELVNSLVMVDLCLIGQEDDIFKTVNLVKPQIIALGYDQV
ncbi:MAG: adenylyltransferase/cytidyltransferase family protein, partial [Nitrosarchaeum sp.]